jgi:hypothetical protein
MDFQDQGRHFFLSLRAALTQALALLLCTPSVRAGSQVRELAVWGRPNNKNNNNARNNETVAQMPKNNYILPKN